MRTYPLLAFCLAILPLFSRPQDPHVVNGKASFHKLENGLEIRSKDNTIMDWKSFCIDKGEMVKFIQSSNGSAILNRVIGTEKSLINGLLHSNGHVLLLNKNGILIGKEGVIDTAGFIGSTLDLSNDQFLQGKDLFFQGDSKASIINYGKIQAREGDLFLIAYHIQNEGEVAALKAVAGFGIGSGVLIAMNDEERLWIRSPASDGNLSTAGLIRAAQVELKARGNPYALAISQDGQIEASCVERKNGRVFLVAEEGLTQVAGSIQVPSGEVRILGNAVHLLEEASIDVSGLKGGTVLLGGDERGKNPSILNAHTTLIHQGAIIRADGLEENGGKVIVWADEKTHYFGEISCQALGNQGDGGFVEISAKSSDYRFSGKVTTASQCANTGQLLLDPTDITITTLPSNPPFPTTPPGTYQPTTNTANLDRNDIQTALASNNVTIDSTDPTGAGAGTITLSESITWGSSNSLTLTAYQGIVVNANITSTGSGDLNLVAQGSASGEYNGILINSGSTLSSNTGAITLNGIGQTATTSGLAGILLAGDITSIAGEISLTGAVSGIASNSNGILVSGSITTATNGNITLNGTSTNAAFGNGVYLQSATITNTGTGQISITGIGCLNGNTSPGILLETTTLQSQGSIILEGTGQDFSGMLIGISASDSTLQISGTGTLSITTTAGDFLDVGTGVGSYTTTSGTIDLISAGGITINTPISTLSGVITLTANSGSIYQTNGIINASTTGSLFLNATSGITGIGSNSSLQTICQTLNAQNSATGDLRIENQLIGDNSFFTLATLSNGMGAINNNQNLYYSQIGGSSAYFTSVSTNGTATILALEGKANLWFLGDVNIGSDFLAASNLDLYIDPITMNLQGTATFIVDQSSPTTVGNGFFISNGVLNVATNNLSIYAAAGFQAPTNATALPPNQTILNGSLVSVPTWDISLPGGLATKYNTSYSNGGSNHGSGFGNNYTPGNGVFGSQVVWYKFNVQSTISPPPAFFNPLVGINAWEIDYLLLMWNEDLMRLSSFCDGKIMLYQDDCQNLKKKVAFETEDLLCY